MEGLAEGVEDTWTERFRMLGNRNLLEMGIEEQVRLLVSDALGAFDRLREHRALCLRLDGPRHDCGEAAIARRAAAAKQETVFFETYAQADVWSRG